MKERATFAKDIYENGKFFFEKPTSYDEKALKKAWNDETASLIKELSTQFENTDFQAENLQNIMHDFAESKSLGMGKVMMPLRLSLVGELKGPDVPDMLEILGKEESIARIKNAVNSIS